MDLLSGKGDLIIVMEHVDSKGRPKLRRKCTYPADRQGMRQLRGDRPGAAALGRSRFVLDAVAPGFTPKDVIALTEMDDRGRAERSGRWSDGRPHMRAVTFSLIGWPRKY